MRDLLLVLAVFAACVVESVEALTIVLAVLLGLQDGPPGSEKWWLVYSASFVGALMGLALKSVPKGKLEAEVMKLAARMGLVDPHLLSANKRLVNLGLELMGARTLQRIGAEIDARGHLAPKAREFRETMREHGVKFAFQKRDAAFGSGFAAVHGPDSD